MSNTVERCVELLIPEDGSDLTLAWFNSALHHAGVAPDAAASINVRELGKGGECSVVYLIEPRYHGAGDGLPVRFVAKLPTHHEDLRQVMADTGRYRAECNFYRYAQPDSTFNSPRCFYTAISADDRSFVILLEYVDQAEPGIPLMTDLAKIDAAITEVACLHADWWGQEQRLQPFVQLFSGADLAQRLPMFETGLAHAEANYGARFGADYLALMRRVLQHIDHIAARILAAPQTLIHGDCHAIQMLFSDGPPVDVALIDWQYCALGTGVSDLSRFLLNAMSSDLRLAHDERLITLYHRTLCANGVLAYSREQLLEDFRYSLILTQILHLSLLHAIDLDSLSQFSQPYGMDWFGIMYERQAQAMFDYDVGALLPDH